jgi:hypothetical protein
MARRRSGSPWVSRGRRPVRRRTASRDRHRSGRGSRRPRAPRRPRHLRRARPDARADRHHHDGRRLSGLSHARRPPGGRTRGENRRGRRRRGRGALRRARASGSVRPPRRARRSRRNVRRPALPPSAAGRLRPSPSPCGAARPTLRAPARTRIGVCASTRGAARVDRCAFERCDRAPIDLDPGVGRGRGLGRGCDGRSVASRAVGRGWDAACRRGRPRGRGGVDRGHPDLAYEEGGATGSRRPSLPGCGCAVGSWAEAARGGRWAGGVTSCFVPAVERSGARRSHCPAHFARTCPSRSRRPTGLAGSPGIGARFGACSRSCQPRRERGHRAAEADLPPTRPGVRPRDAPGAPPSPPVERARSEEGGARATPYHSRPCPTT